MTGRGMGDTWKLDSDGNWVNCDDWTNIFTLACWNPANPQLAGPSASNPTTPSNPLTDAAIGVSTTGSGAALTTTDWLSALVTPTTIMYVGVAIAGVYLADAFLRGR